MTVIVGSSLARPVFDACDVVVVGSGAGGAVVAAELASFGLDVVIVEEGPMVPRTEYASLSPMRTLRRIGREAGLAVALGLGATPVISTLAGRVVGGSSTLTGGVCFRIPAAVLHEWQRDRGLATLGEDALAPHFDAVERRIHVEEVPPHMRPRGTERFIEGAAKIGVPMKPLRRNTHGCHGESRCNFGCPHGAKLSVDVTYLPDAFARGARLYSDALVEKVETAHNRAFGVRGVFRRDGDRSAVPFVIRAKTVVVACGALHTPLLLARSGITSREVGRNLTLHPAFRVAGLWDERLEHWDGALQSVYSDEETHGEAGLTFVAAASAPSILSAAFPGVGAAHRALAEKLPELGVFGGMVHDDAGGRVRRFIGREPLVTYRMSARDRARMFRGIRLLGEMAFAGGARAVLLPIFGLPPVTRASDLAALEESPPPAHRVECMSFHPLGSARMSARADAGVVKESGESWQVDNLFVADGSVVPTSIGVNSQLPIMAMARRIAHRIAADWSTLARRAS